MKRFPAMAANSWNPKITASTASCQDSSSSKHATYFFDWFLRQTKMTK